MNSTHTVENPRSHQMTLDYFYGQSGELFSYFRIPKALFQDCRFRQLSTDARTLYGILLDRMSLSVKERLAGRAGAGVYHLHRPGSAGIPLLRRTQGGQAVPGTGGHRPHRAQTPWSGQTQPDLRQGLFLRTCQKRKYRIAQTAIQVLPKAQFWSSQNRKQIRLIRIKQSGTILTLSIPGASGSSLRIIFIRHWR